MLMKGFNSQIYDMLFTLMTTIKTEEFNKEIWALLCRLPPSPLIMDKII